MLGLSPRLVQDVAPWTRAGHSNRSTRPSCPRARSLTATGNLLFPPGGKQMERAEAACVKRNGKPPRNKHFATRRKTGQCYTRHSYRVAIARACKRAGVDVRTPYRIRHTRATELRRLYYTSNPLKSCSSALPPRHDADLCRARPGQGERGRAASRLKKGRAKVASPGAAFESFAELSKMLRSLRAARDPRPAHIKLVVAPGLP